MKRNVSLLIFVLFLLPIRPVFAGAGRSANEIILTADQVDGANDIEAVIFTATANGTRPGTVLLDGSKGAFLFTDLDRSLNIMVSNLTLRGVNLARIENCDDGLFFDNLAIQHILVENIQFFCSGDGVDAGSAIHDVSLRNNLFQAGTIGISQGGTSTGWKITGNTVIAGGPGMLLQRADGFVITDNHISGFIGLQLAASSNVKISDNMIHAAYQGVLLYQEAWRNKVQQNTIIGVSQSGIALEPGVTNNLIANNRVLCATANECLPVDAGPEAQENNRFVPSLP